MNHSSANHDSCTHCGYLLTPRSGEDGPPAAGTASCPVCHDGRVDPWAMIREIRTLITQQSSVFDSHDPLLTDWPLLRHSIRLLWPALGPHLPTDGADRASVEGLIATRLGYNRDVASALLKGLLDLHERFHGQWGIIREAVPRRWPALRPMDIERMDGTLSELTLAVGRVLDLDVVDARTQVVRFLQALHYPALVHVAGPQATAARLPDPDPEETDGASAHGAGAQEPGKARAAS